MTIDIQELSGKPLIAVIDSLCMAVTPRWKEFRGYISIFENQTIICHDPEYLGFGIQVLGADKSSKEVQEEADAADFAKTLRPLFAQLKAGNPRVEAIRISHDGAAPQLLEAGHFRRKWKLYLYDGQATLISLNSAGESISEFALDLLIAHSEAKDSRAVQVASEPSATTRRVRGKAKQDEPLLVMMQSLILAGEAKTPWLAAKHLVETKKVPAGGTDESQIKRLHKEYMASGRPTEQPAQSSTRVTQK